MHDHAAQAAELREEPRADRGHVGRQARRERCGTGFGDLNADVNIRLAALATLGMALGVQSATAGFLIGLVRLGRRTQPAENAGAAAPEAESEKSPEPRRKDEAA